MCKDREWIQSIISHQDTEPIPYFFDFSPPALSDVEKYYGTPVEDVLEFPIRWTGCETVKPLYADPLEFGEKAIDEFGVVWSTSKIDRGAPISPCLNKADLSGYSFPDFKASYRFENLEKWLQKNSEHYTIIWAGDLWERATFMRGMDNILLDLVLNPYFVEELLCGITDYILGTMKILFDNYQFDCIGISDDYGAQESMLMSPSHWRKFIKPQLKRIYNLAKKHGRNIFHHSDGHIYPIIQDLVDMGCDILHPIQPEAMDVFNLKRKFGQHLTLWGGISTQNLLVRGTPENIRNEVKKLKRELGRGGGYIMSNGITIQADVPLDNIIAMIDEARTTESV